MTTPATDNYSEVNAVIVNVVLTIVAAALFLGAGVTKVTMQPRMAASAEHFGLSKSVYRMVGALEILAVVGLIAGLVVWSLFGILAAVGLVLMMIGALSFHIRAKDPVKEVAPAGVAGLLSVAVLITQIAA